MPSASDAPHQQARLEWDEQGQPLSSQFADVYFSNENALAETRYVFLANNQLPERFAALTADQQLVIGETGFGTGLNFLCAWQLFEQQAARGARLHFVSVEKYPLNKSDLQRALALWPELAPYAEQLLAQYVALHPGFQRLIFADGRIVLTLLIGDALELFGQLDAQVDAWFLDGFAPAKNPDMWTPELFSELARLSHASTTLGTFTSTGYVRRRLNEAGFKMKRVPGLGKKWEVLKGTFIGAQVTAEKPWFTRPPQPVGERSALVIGAGLAGCATAASLAQRGWQVTLLERHAAIAQEASGNPQGVLYLKLSAHHTTLSRLIVSGYGHSRRLLEQLQKGTDWDNCGVLQLAFDAKEAQRQTQLAAAFPPDLLTNLDRNAAAAKAGIPLPAGGLFYPEAGWVHPPALCALLGQQPTIQLQLHQEALELRRDGDSWQAWNGEQLLASASVVVLASAAEIKSFTQAAHLPLKRIRGQISRLPATTASRALSTVVCAEGYVAPVRLDEHTLGASFDFNSDDLTLNSADHASNLQLLQEISPELCDALNASALDPAQLQGRAAFRCTSPDYLPIVGPLADAAAFAEAYAVLSKDARQVPDAPCPWLDGLYINSGHGSRGLITAPLSGELIAAWLNDEPLPVPADVAQACHPNRFALRALIRNKP
ncbi:MAG: bifunctional tRNA (5-methylaminomethyl-2-thiouridine)(34)-methyltransferase MnmD/FAD-dependent 5-carboxymethylaminomethyl-2-thiouridine(34) oxidoreductase MnmC [Pseudomonas sp.]|uniref:bifunctional tRNA (5-methylaminomethyl-2-thiouridine)(34)-methyltransferase MnmD/FAD-dependent 5-carboxymethylaminomethyl-2-thiouridine(34) oxidoreductase MnmC n=1 Tax=Pseudomonas sp. TaxID=306 RepID=UPI002724A62D|nr:bifunctional tRNA (5-methylaminomethyl-2-thiouridine)(34)-methyltransferase MnmD/FAD-dependent 5-carboxymethylaminomethyl-2-thiouridine(34) oxidoreductase MnmC [Pseudomonas sp.]MDO9618206.1 bifunctional tRNA (5-methylaminomethyl-2-thiouridine)(34)-methyltransferase MnmD/FAD-dependent 5-carboxymethylaminomethyl-2-thiouridine(34) oxidoreductase MnmC [Pseudomonas sp.]MDP2445040.1 bifunctional tRNA (5-methylaminomethyl-2-thiouridine)(34)-methyltransferase MnmD/FAD-dependent 5-carboxymethylaminomet